MQTKKIATPFLLTTLGILFLITVSSLLVHIAFATHKQQFTPPTYNQIYVNEVLAPATVGAPATYTLSWLAVGYTIFECTLSRWDSISEEWTILATYPLPPSAVQDSYQENNLPAGTYYYRVDCISLSSHPTQPVDPSFDGWVYVDANLPTMTPLPTVSPTPTSPGVPNTPTPYPTNPPQANQDGYVWYDENRNGVQDAGENGVSDITIRLWDITRQVVAEEVTPDSSGYYEVYYNPLDTYALQFRDYGEQILTAPDIGDDDDIDSDINPQTGYSHIIGANQFLPPADIDGGIVEPPPESRSYYIKDHTPSAMVNLGCELATLANNSNTRKMFTALIFGQMRYITDLPIPIIAVRHYGFQIIDLDQVKDASINFANGYDNCLDSSPTSLEIAISVTNNDFSGSHFFSFSGANWREMVIQTNNEFGNDIFISFVGGIDFEEDPNEGWVGAVPSVAWVNYYHNTSNPPFLYFIGQTDCPHVGTIPNPQVTGVCGGDYTPEDVWKIADGNFPKSRTIPQIYSPLGNNAQSWRILSKMAYDQGWGPIRFEGTLTQFTACQQRPNDNTCPTTNSPNEGWGQLWQEINNNPYTSQIGLPFSTDIGYQGETIP